MSVTSRDSVTMIDDDQVTVARVRSSIDHKSVSSCRHWRAEVHGYVEAFVHLAPFTVEGIAPHAEPVRHVAIHGQPPGDRGQAKNVRTQTVVDMTHLAL